MWKRWLLLGLGLGGLTLLMIVAVVGPPLWQSWSTWRAGWRSPHVQRLVAAPHGSYIDARWSPDGQWIAAVVRREEGNGLLKAHILLLRPDGSLVHELPTPDGVDTVPSGNILAWRPDGKLTIIVDLSTPHDVQQRVPPDRTALFQLDPFDPEHDPHLILDNLAPITSADWSPDGTHLVLAQEVGPRMPVTSTRDVGLVVYDSQVQQFDVWQHHDTMLSRPRWQPNGRAVMYEVENYNRTTGQSHNGLILRPWPTGREQRLIQDNCRFDAIDWSPDGTQLIYRETCTGYQWGQQVMRIAPPEQLQQGTQVCDDHVFYHTDWGPNNQVLGLMAEYPGDHRLYMCSVGRTK